MTLLAKLMLSSIVMCVILSWGTLLGQTIESEATTGKQVQALVGNYCFDCHNESEQNGGVRLDQLSLDLSRAEDAETWQSVLDVLNAGEMPPDEAPQPSSDQRQQMVDWITQSLRLAAESRNQSNVVLFRRLTRSQYSNSLQSLLGVLVDFGDALPSDGKSKIGFSNNGQVLQTTALHLDYYEKIARQALDQAIVIGDRPTPFHYKVTLGAKIDPDERGVEVKGYQETPLPKSSFRVERIGDDHGQPDHRDSIGIGMRGSASDRYQVTADGMLLYSALPHMERVPKSWQGPSPNLKLLFLNNFPREGDFRVRVRASRSDHWDIVGRRGGMISLRENLPVQTTPNTVTLRATDCQDHKNLELKNDRWLMPTSAVQRAAAKFVFETAEAGLYQIDFVHPPADPALMPSYSIEIDGFRCQERIPSVQEKSDETAVVTPVTLFQLKPGRHNLMIGGSFFVGFSEVRVTPLPKGHPVTVELDAEVKNNIDKYADQIPALRAFAGARTDDGMDYRIFDRAQRLSRPAGEMESFEFIGRLENLPLPFPDPGSTDPLANISIVGIWNDYLVNQSADSGPVILVQSIEVEAPYYSSWPPPSHRRIFFPAESVQSKYGSPKYTREVIRRFAARAFRRPLSQSEADRYFEFWQDSRNDFDDYEASVKEVLVAILCSPNFLYIGDVPVVTSQSQFPLASKLAYFLWDSPPDETTISLAVAGKLQSSLRQETRRMIDSPKVRRMVESFAHQWLRIDRLENMNFNVRRYPSFNRFVKADMAEETYQYLMYLLKYDLSINHLIDSDFAMLNQNLANFYGIDGVTGSHFRPVNVPRSQHRGGLLSQGAFLTGHSDGVVGHPIKRAVWLKEKILGDPPPPPPPNVPELDPDTPGFNRLTLKQKLRLHRDKDSCRSCHQRIDPFGVVFENYDAVGKFRSGEAQPRIDAKSRLPDGTKIDGVAEMKDYILQRKQQEFSTAVVKHLFAYAVGRDVTFADQIEIKGIVDRARERGDGLATIVEELILSRSFRGNFETTEDRSIEETATESQTLEPSSQEQADD